MKKFLIKILAVVFIFCGLLLFLIFLKNESLIINDKTLVDNEFKRKIEMFNNFNKYNKSINLILGSSMIKDALIPDSLGTNWFSLAFDATNIYENYKLLDSLKSYTDIDTVIIGLNPFSLPYSYTKNRLGRKPYLNGNFFYFGTDSITSIVLEETRYELIKNFFFPSISLYLKNRALDRRNYKIISKQGFSGNLEKGKKIIPFSPMDANYEPIKGYATKYFHNYKKNANLSYINTFLSLTNSLEIFTIFVVTPKSKKYIDEMKFYGFADRWHSALKAIQNKNVNLWNYEQLSTNSDNFYWFSNSTHLSYDGAKSFTKIIKNRLKEN